MCQFLLHLLMQHFTISFNLQNVSFHMHPKYTSTDYLLWHCMIKYCSVFLVFFIEIHLYYTTEISGPDISQSVLFYKQVLYTTSVVIINICITYNDFCFVSFWLFTDISPILIISRCMYYMLYTFICLKQYSNPFNKCFVALFFFFFFSYGSASFSSASKNLHCPYDFVIS